MPTPKVVQLVHKCNECPHKHYDSGGTYRCELACQAILDVTRIAPFCPLADYPSATIARMDQTIRMLREPYQYALVHAVFSHIATKLKTTLMEKSMSIKMPLRDREDPLYLRLDHVQSISMSPGAEILFIDGDSTFKLFPDTSPPALYELTTRPGIEGELLRELKLL